MCDDDQQARKWQLYIQDMIEFSERALSYTSGMDQGTFIAETLVYDGTLRNLELIGEAATHIPDEVREAHPEVQWRRIIATRNRLAHSYLGVDDDVLWDIIQTDVPKLLTALRKALETTNEDSS